VFFFIEDILWFKPVELRTKHGRRGHIKEPLGKLSVSWCYKYRIRANIGGYNIWRFDENMDLAKSFKSNYGHK